MRRDPRFLRYVQWRVLAADPRVEITLVYRTLRRVMTKVAAGAARMALGLLVRARQPQSG